MAAAEEGTVANDAPSTSTKKMEVDVHAWAKAITSMIASQSEALSALLQAHQSDVSQAEVDSLSHGAILSMTQAAMELVTVLEGKDVVDEVLAQAQKDWLAQEGGPLAS